MTLHLSTQMLFNMLMTDCTIILSYNTITDLQISLIELGKNITKYMSAHDLKINVTKTEIMLFKEKESVELEFLNERLNSVPKAKFLRIIITPDLNFDHYIENNIIPNISFFHILPSFLIDNSFLKLLFFLLFRMERHSYLIPAVLKYKSLPLYSIAL